MSLLLQLYADLPEWFPGHERRLYVFGCRRKPCRRKAGCVRALRAVRASAVPPHTAERHEIKPKADERAQPAVNLGETLFGAKSSTPAQSNPFSTTASSGASNNPFAAAGSKSTTTAKSEPSLNETFAEKARIPTTTTPSPQSPQIPSTPWQQDPSPYPSYHIDADKEYLEPEPATVPGNARLDTEDASGSSSSAAEDKAAFESAMDKTFQHFADRLSQNPEQILRYEFGGQPLLYSKSDAAGKVLSYASEAKVQTSSTLNGSSVSKVPRCPSCGAGRSFELQLTPHAITELEADEMGVDGMEWGTIIVCVCSSDCTEKGKDEGQVGYVEEWVGVQWEEVVSEKKR